MTISIQNTCLGFLLTNEHRPTKEDECIQHIDCIFVKWRY